MVPITVWSTLVWPGMTVSLQTSGTVYRSSCRDITGRLHDVSVASDCSVDRYPAYIIRRDAQDSGSAPRQVSDNIIPYSFFTFLLGTAQMFWMNNRSGQHSKTTSQQSTVRR